MLFAKENKNWLILYGLFVLVIVGTIGYYQSKLDFYEGDVKEKDSQCWLWVVNADGNGFGTTTDYCVQLKNNCNDVNNNHRLPCEWISSDLVDYEGSKTGKSTEGCSCRVF